MAKMQENFCESDMHNDMDPLGNTNMTERLEKQSHDVAKEFNDPKKDEIPKNMDQCDAGMCSLKNGNGLMEQRRESDVRNKEI